MKIVRAWGAVLLIGILFLLTACGGGNGSSSGNNSISNAVYIGSTSQATITASNAKPLATTAYQNVQTAISLAALKRATDVPVGDPLAVTISNIVEKDAISAVMPQFKPSAKTVEATSTQQSTVNGYSGSATVSITVDTTSGNCLGVFAFNHYVSAAGSPSLQGAVTFSGVFNSTTGGFDSFAVTIEVLMTSSRTYSTILNGSLTAKTSGSSKTITMSAVLTDSNSHKSKVDGYEVVLTGSSLTVKGTFYDGTSGYVVLTTVTPIQLPGPTAGQIVVTGANNTRARLTFNSSGYVVEYDSGNGVWVVVN